MSITVLPSMANPKKAAIGAMDSLGRLVVYGAGWNRTTHLFTGVGKTERYDPGAGSWSTLHDAISSTQLEAHGMDSSDRFYRVGGQLVAGGGGALTSAAEYYDPVGNTWTTIASLALPLYLTFNWMDSSGVLWIMSGATDTTGSVNPDTNGIMSNARKYSGGPGGTWTTLSSTSNSMGGSAPGGNGVVDSTGRGYITRGVWQRYNPASDTWTTLAANPGSANWNLAITPADQVYAVGTGLRRYDIGSDTWSAALATPPVNGVNGLLVYHGPTNALYLIGGFSSVYLTSIYKYDIASNIWSNTGDTLSVGRFLQPGANLVAGGSGFYIFGGVDNNNDGTAAAEYFVPAGGAAVKPSWTAVIG